MINRVKGTQDLLDLALFNYLGEKVKKQFEIYNFTEISTPILEPLDLYVRSLGEETDVIKKEMYLVKGDTKESGSSEEVICLRPEGTASTVRAFVENNIINTPWKVFSIGPMFRHERPQKGRYRQFHQINIEIIGSKAIEQDVQLIKMLDRLFFETLAIESYALLINFLGCIEDRKKFKLILSTFLESKIATICSTCKVRKDKNSMRIFDCKNDSCTALYQEAPAIVDCLCDGCKLEWQSILDNLEHLSVSYSIKKTLVRGLDYYSKTVFEFVSPDLGAQNAFCGGGRYDQLALEIGAKEDQPSVGAAIGIERLMLVLDAAKDRLLMPQKMPLYIIMPMAKEQHALALLLADELQAQKLCCDILLEDDSVKSKMRKANKMGAKFVIIVGEDEQRNRMVTLKNMITGSEEKIAQSTLVAYLK